MWTVIGHENAVSLLRRSLEKETVAHAYLLVGPAHCGKMAIAVNLAQALNCNGEEPPCGVCDSCRRILEGKHADIRVTELLRGDDSAETLARTRIGVEQVDEILHSVNLPPFEGKRKVFIIDGTEHLSIGAANRMLKTLEEPVSNVVFILLTVNEAMVPATVISRCQRIELFPLPLVTIENALVSRWCIEPVRAKLLARLSAGCLGWAVTMSQNGVLLQQRNDWLDDWLEVMEGDFDTRFSFVAKMAERYSQNRETVQQKLTLLLDWWRDVLLVKAGNASAVVNIDREDALNAIAAGYSLGQIRDCIRRIESVIVQMRQNVSAQLALEVLMLNIPERAKVNRAVHDT